MRRGHGDDAICFKTTSLIACRDVTVDGCTLKSHWAAVKFGTESLADFENIKVTHCRIADTQGGGFKLLSVDGAKIQNVEISDITMTNVSVPVFIRLGARLKTFRAGDEKQSVGTVRNIHIKNVKAQSTWPVGVMISGIPGHPVEGVTAENIEIHAPGGGTRDDADTVLEEKEAAYPEYTMFGKKMPVCGVYARHVKDLRISGLTLDLAQPDLRPVALCEDAEGVEFSNWKTPGNPDAACLVRFDSVKQAGITGFGVEGRLRTFLRVEGAGSGQIRLKENRVTTEKSLFELGTGVKSGTVVTQ